MAAPQWVSQPQVLDVLLCFLFLSSSPQSGPIANPAALSWKYIQNLITSHHSHTACLAQATIISHVDYCNWSSCFFPYPPLIFFSTKHHGTLVKTSIRSCHSSAYHPSKAPLLAPQKILECLRRPPVIWPSLFSNLVSIYFLLGEFIFSRICLFAVLQTYWASFHQPLQLLFSAWHTLLQTPKTYMACSSTSFRYSLRVQLLMEPSMPTIVILPALVLPLFALFSP